MCSSDLNEKTGRALAERYGYRWADELRDDVNVLINASPIGMTGGPEAEQLAFTEDRIRSAELLFDVVAIPVETPLIRKGRALEKKLITGFDVIALQALEQFVLYTGVRPPAELVREAAEFALM